MEQEKIITRTVKRKFLVADKGIRILKKGVGVLGIVGIAAVAAANPQNQGEVAGADEKDSIDE